MAQGLQGSHSVCCRCARTRHDRIKPGIVHPCHLRLQVRYLESRTCLSMRTPQETNTRGPQKTFSWKRQGVNARKRLCWSLSAGNQDEPSLGFDSLYEKDVPDFDDIVLDDDFYKSMEMTREEAEASQNFNPSDADPEGKDFTIDDIAALAPDTPEYIKEGLAHGHMFGPPIMVMAGFRIEELPVARSIVDAAGGQEVKVVPLKEEMLHKRVEEIVEIPEPDWEKPRPDDFAMAGGWGSQRTIMFGGMKVEAQAAVIELLEEGGLPAICPICAIEETRHMKLGELLADAVKYQRFRHNPDKNPWDVDDRVTKELPDIHEHMQDAIKKRVSAVKEGIQQGIVDMEEDEDGHLNIKFKKEVMDRLKKEQDGSSQEIGQDWQEMSDEELGAHSLDKIDLEKMEEDLKKLSENGDGEELRKWFEEQEALLDVLGASQSEVSKESKGQTTNSESRDPAPDENRQDPSTAEAQPNGENAEHDSELISTEADQEEALDRDCTSFLHEINVEKETSRVSDDVNVPTSDGPAAKEDLLSQGYTDDESRGDAVARDSNKTEKADLPPSESKVRVKEQHVNSKSTGATDDSQAVQSSQEELKETQNGRENSSTSDRFDTSDMFLIDNLVTSTLGLDPPKRPEPEPEMSMDDLLQLPLGPGSEGTKTDADGRDKTVIAPTDALNKQTGSETIYSANEKASQIVDKNSVVLPASSESQQSLESNEIADPRGSAEKGLNVDNSRETVEPDRVLPPPTDAEDELDEDKEPFVTRSEVPIGTEDDLDAWIRLNTDEVSYDPQEHASLFKNQESSIDGSNIAEDPKSQESMPLKNDERAYEEHPEDSTARADDEAEIVKRALCKAVDDGASPAMLKSIIDSLDSKKKNASRKSASRGKESFSKGNSRLRIPKDVDVYKAKRPSSKVKERLSFESTIIPVETDDFEVVHENIPTTSEEWNTLFGTPFYEDGEDDTILQSREPEQSDDEESEQTTDSLQIERFDDEGAMSIAQLAAAAKRRGVSLDSLLEDAEKRGIEIRK